MVEKGRKRKKGAGKKQGKGGEETACVEQDQTVTEEWKMAIENEAEGTETDVNRVSADKEGDGNWNYPIYILLYDSKLWSVFK